jgi:hypothetical protein
MKDRSQPNQFSVECDHASRAEGAVMRQQILKGLTMLLAVMSLAMITAVASANGQSVNARASIPFEFVVGDKTLPAGAYTVNSITTSGETLRIRGNASENSAVRMTTTSVKKSEKSMLVFHRYDNRYFLSEVWSAGDGRILAASKEERAIQKEMSRIASNRSTGRAYETVELALNAR